MKIAKCLQHAATILIAAIAGFSTVSIAKAAHMEEKFDVLETRIGTYTNVTVTTHGKNSIFIMHSKGMATIFLSDLSSELQKQLGYLPGAKKEEIKSSAQVQKFMASIHLPQMKQFGKFDKEFEAKIQKAISSPMIVIVLLGSIVLIYFFTCFCLMLICKKTGTEPGILVWLPILQIFPMLRAAGMSGAWFLAFLVPGLNILAHIIWCFKIVSAREKNVLFAIMLLLPILNMLAFLYLAFSNGGESGSPRKEKSEGQGIALQAA